MGSTQKGTIYQMVKTNKTGSKVTVSAHKGAEITTTNPQQGQASVAASTHRSAAISVSPPTHRRSEPAHSIIPNTSPNYPGTSYPQSGPSSSGAPIPRGTDRRSKSEAYRHSSLQRKLQQAQTPPSYAVHMKQNSPTREESPRRRGESKSGRDSNRYSLIPDAKPPPRLSFLDQKDNIQTLQEDPPSKVQYPQGVRVPRRTLVCPKDEAVQTEPIRKSMTAAEIKSQRSASSPEQVSSRLYAAQRRIPGQESELGHRSAIYTEPKALHRNKNLESSVRLSVLKDVGGGHRVSMHTEPESTHKHSAYTETRPSPKAFMSSEVEANMKSPVLRDSETHRRVTISSGVQEVQSSYRVTPRAVSESAQRPSMYTSPEPVYKQQTQGPSESICMPPGPSPSPSAHAKVELTPRPLPPRSLPRYGPDCSWWTLLNRDVEMPQSRPTTPDFEPKYPSPVDYSLSFFEMDSNPFCEDLVFQREKASPSPPPARATPPPHLQLPKEPPSWAPLREVPQTPKHTSKQPTQRFSAFFLGM